MISERRNDIYNRLLIGLLFYSLFVTILNYVLPITVLGYSVFITFIPTVITYSLFISLIPSFNRKDTLLFFSLLFLTILVYAGQVILKITSQNPLKYFVGHRYIFSIFIYVLIFTKLDFKKYTRIYVYICMLGLLFCSITSILYLFGLPTFKLDNINAEGYVENSRFGGLWGAPNVFSNTLIMLLAINLYFLPQNRFLKVILFVTAFFGWIASGSRSVIVYFALLLPFAVNHFKSINKGFTSYLKTLLIAAGIILAMLYATGALDKLIDMGGALKRLSEESAGEDVRKEKNATYINYLLSDVRYFAFGVPGEIQQGNNGDVEFSDNGVLLFLLENGIPFALFYALIIYILVSYTDKKIKFSMGLGIFLLILLLTSVTNNDIMWDHYVFTCILFFFLLISNQQNIEIENKKITSLN